MEIGADVMRVFGRRHRGRHTRHGLVVSAQPFLEIANLLGDVSLILARQAGEGGIFAVASKPWQPPQSPALPSPAAGSPLISACAAEPPIIIAATTAHTCNLFSMSLPSRCLSVIPPLRTRFRLPAGGICVYYRLCTRRQSACR